MSDLLRICTAGSVDDGKSTLIGRLRKFILADTPGHEQYTRNMATGAFTADVAILLVDARHGVLPQTRLHARIARLLGISELVLAINKMDLVDFDQTVFDSIVADFADLYGEARVRAIPISALEGDNITVRSERTPWYHGDSLLGYLESLQIERGAARAQFRYPVQLVLRPDDGFRGYAGRILAGRVRAGDEVSAWPSGRTTRIARIVTRDGDLRSAQAPLSVVLTLEDELDLSRGDSLTVGAPSVGNCFSATVVWLDERPLDPARRYQLKHTTRMVTAAVDRSLQLNEIGSVVVTTSRPLIFDPYEANRATGSFVLIDPDSNFTAGAGMIIEQLDRKATASSLHDTAKRVAMIARAAATETEAIDSVRLVLEEMYQ